MLNLLRISSAVRIEEIDLQHSLSSLHSPKRRRRSKGNTNPSSATISETRFRNQRLQPSFGDNSGFAVSLYGVGFLLVTSIPSWCEESLFVSEMVGRHCWLECWRLERQHSDTKIQILRILLENYCIELLYNMSQSYRICKKYEMCEMTYLPYYLLHMTQILSHNTLTCKDLEFLCTLNWPYNLYATPNVFFCFFPNDRRPMIIGWCPCPLSPVGALLRVYIPFVSPDPSSRKGTIGGLFSFVLLPVVVLPEYLNRVRCKV